MVRTGEAQEHFQQAEELFYEDRFAEAIDEFIEVIKLQPDDAESYDMRGISYKNLKQPEKALADYDKAISLRPKKDPYYSRRGHIYIVLGKMEKAVPDLEKAVGLNPDRAGLYYYSFGGQIIKYTGNKHEAAVYYKKSVEHGDYSDMARKALAEMGV